MQHDTVSHLFQPDVYFEDVIERYNFDRLLRVILFEAVEQIENAPCIFLYRNKKYYNIYLFLLKNVYLCALNT
jgi:hypothetical protein